MTHGALLGAAVACPISSRAPSIDESKSVMTVMAGENTAAAIRADGGPLSNAERQKLVWPTASPHAEVVDEKHETIHR